MSGREVIIHQVLYFCICVTIPGKNTASAAKFWVDIILYPYKFTKFKQVKQCGR